MFQKTITAFLVLLFCTNPANAAEESQTTKPSAKKKGQHVAIVTRIKGDVTILTNPSKTVDEAAEKASESTHVAFDGQYYIAKKAKKGLRLRKGNVIRSAPNSKARLIFKNGDSLTVAAATSYRISWKKEDSAPVIDLFYGKIRGIFKKGGLRSGTKVKTKSSVMGVRGTDFVVISKGSTEVSVMRGAVSLKPTASKAKAVTLETGFSAEIKAPAPKVAKTRSNATDPKEVTQEEAAPAPIEIRKTSKQELVAIQTSMNVAKSLPPAQNLALTGEKQSAEDIAMEKELAELEAECTKTVMEDIKKTDPMLFEKIKDKKNVDAINTASMGELFKKAPDSPKKDLKPSDKELQDLGDDAYEKYFTVPE